MMASKSVATFESDILGEEWQRIRLSSCKGNLKRKDELVQSKVVV
jgi:hypothetical protein